jgi:pimeloyl-ACP methyl ester carboxylesterase
VRGRTRETFKEKMADLHNWRTLYPFESHWLDLDGHRYHYVDEGQGEVLLAVHGNPTWSFYWRNLILGLRDRYRVIAIDHIGCGLSDKPADYPYRMVQHAANLERLIESLGLEQITLLAHDWGGAIGLTAALDLPDRFARFVLFNTGAWPPRKIPLPIALCRIPILGRLGVQGLNLFARPALSMAVEHRERMTQAVRAGLLAPYDTWGNRRATYQFVQDIPRGPNHPTYAPLARLVQQAPSLGDRPMQLIWGMKDWCFDSACLGRFEAMFPDAEAERLDDAGHYVVEDAWERIVPLVDDFLVRHPLSPGGS